MTSNDLYIRVYGKIRYNYYFLNIKVIIENLKKYGNLFNKLLMKSLHAFKSYCQNRENYEINGFYKFTKYYFYHKL